jgi:hypothetical protein
VGKLVEKVGSGDMDFTIDNPPIVGLLIYEYDLAQRKADHWDTHISKLKEMPILHAGDPGAIKLVCGEFPKESRPAGH